MAFNLRKTFEEGFGGIDKTAAVARTKFNRPAPARTIRQRSQVVAPLPTPNVTVEAPQQQPKAYVAPALSTPKIASVSAVQPVPKVTGVSSTPTGPVQRTRVVPTTNPDELRGALGDIQSYSPDDQIRIINRSSKAGVVPRNVAATEVSQALETPLYNPTELGKIKQFGLQAAKETITDPSKLAEAPKPNIGSFFGSGFIEDTLFNNPSRMVKGTVQVGQGEYKKGFGNIAAGTAGSSLGFLPVTKVAQAGSKVTTGLLPKIATGAKVGAKEGAIYGGLYAGGDAASRDGTTADILKSTAVGSTLGAVGGAIIGGGLPAVVPTTKLIGRGAVKANSKFNNTLSPRVNLREQAVLRDFSDALMGVNKAGGRELSDLITQAHIVGEKYGIDLTNGSVVDRLERSNMILDQIGRKTKDYTQRGFVRIPGGSKDIAPDLGPEQKEFINAYAEMLESMGSGNGVDVLPNGTRVSNNFRSPEVGSGSMSKANWFDQARKEIESGKAAYGASDDYAKLPAPYTPLDKTPPSTPEQIPQSKAPSSSNSSIQDPEFDSLVKTMEGGDVSPITKDAQQILSMNGVPTKVKVKSSGGEKNIPVSSMERVGDVIKAKNVNPNIKKGEKRYSVDDNGELLEDSNGAYRLFTDGEGHVKQFRIGDEVYSANDLGDLSSVNGYGSTLASQRRNIERAFGKETAEKVNSFVVDHQQAQATKMIERNLEYKNNLQSIAKDLGISFGIGRGKAKRVSADIQNFGEGIITKSELDEKYGQEYANKIVEADNWFRGQYDTLLDEMNDTLVKYGYEPVPKRKDYYTHFQDESLWKNFGLRMKEIRDWSSPTLQDAMTERGRGSVSNKMAGQTEYLEPNKRWNPFALKREGAKYTADAFQSFERYLNPTLNNIYMTPSITRARVVAKAIAQEADVAKVDANKTIIQMREWANNLAGKSNRIGDRFLADTMWGPKVLQSLQFAQRRAGANTIVGNLATAALQPVVLSQTAGKFGYKNFLLGALQEMSTAHAKDAPIRKSAFMKRRYADLQKVTANVVERGAEIANAPLKMIEETSARITWNTAHNEALAKGITGDSAIRYADVQTEKTLAGRSIGERPELFNSKTMGPASMYQLEVNNYWQQIGKEMTKKQVAKTLVAAYAFNLGLQQVTGRQVGFNPIDAVIDSYQEFQRDDKTLGEKAKYTGQRLAGEVVDNVPLVAPVANATIGDKSLKKWLGGPNAESNVGRFGISSPIAAIADNPEYLAIPFGGSQLKKTYGGVKAYIDGELKDKDGKTTVNVPKTTENLVKGALFGKSAIPEVGAYYENLGKKKADQKLVPNQSISAAASQSMQGLTKDQQEQYASLGSDTDRQIFRTRMAEKNAKNDTVEKEREAIKSGKSTDTVKKPKGNSSKVFAESGGNYKINKLSNGKYMVEYDGEYTEHNSEKAAKKAIDKKKLEKEVSDFEDSDDRKRVIRGKVYTKKKDGTLNEAKSEFDYEYDKIDSEVKLALDVAKDDDDIGAWMTAAETKRQLLERKINQYDKDSEPDDYNKALLEYRNHVQSMSKYKGYGGFKKPKSGKSAKSAAYKLSDVIGTSDSIGKSLRQILKEAKIK